MALASYSDSPEIGAVQAYVTGLIAGSFFKDDQFTVEAKTIDGIVQPYLHVTFPSGIRLRISVEEEKT